MGRTAVSASSSKTKRLPGGETALRPRTPHLLHHYGNHSRRYYTDGPITFSDAFTNARKIKCHKTYYMRDDTTKSGCKRYEQYHGAHQRQDVTISPTGRRDGRDCDKSLLQDNLKMKCCMPSMLTKASYRAW